ncbi:MAG: hypothetical protein HRU69_03395 [Flammeovirgaceae bacterium]|nr:MAG: hypothetical protein HRU69_03395 [Flammeovirgaceae bacterium]
MKNTVTPTIASVKLIDGLFSSHEAQEVLLDLVNSKIHFHELKNFSSLERIGRPDPVAIQRLPELREERKSIMALTEYAEKNKCTLKITSAIRIELIEEGR